MEETLQPGEAGGFRRWLARHAESKTEIWLILYKKSSGRRVFSPGEALEEAMCHGWIDSRVKSIDDERFVMRFTPCRKHSNWSESNLKLARKLLAEGRMTEAGLAALPEALRHASAKRR